MYNVFNMNDSVTKSKRISFQDLGIKSPIAQVLSSEYHKRMEETRKRWAEEDAKRAKNEK